MYKFCSGHIFTVDQVDYYRCAGSSKISNCFVPTVGLPCPICGRPSEPSRAEVVDMYYQKIVVIHLGSIGDISIKWETCEINDLRPTDPRTS